MLEPNPYNSAEVAEKSRATPVPNAIALWAMIVGCLFALSGIVLLLLGPSVHLAAGGSIWTMFQSPSVTDGIAIGARFVITGAFMAYASKLIKGGRAMIGVAILALALLLVSCVVLGIFA